MKPFRWGLTLLAILLAQCPNPALAKSYKLDTDHTTVGFRVRHLFTSVGGRFDRFDGHITFDPEKPEAVKVTGTIEAGSVSTNLEERDKDLRSSRFFDVAKYPKIEFESASLTEVTRDAATGQLHGKLAGKLRIRGVERNVLLDVRYLGEGKDPWGNLKAGFSAATRINRKDFGLSWNEVLETGGVLVGDDVDIQIDAETYVQP